MQPSLKLNLVGFLPFRYKSTFVGFDIREVGLQWFLMFRHTVSLGFEHRVFTGVQQKVCPFYSKLLVPMKLTLFFSLQDEVDLPEFRTAE